MRDPDAKLALRTNAKVNLFLRVGGRRPDGYHEIETVLHTVGLSDDMEFECTASDALEIEMRASGLPETSEAWPSAEDNLVARVVARYAESGARTTGLRVRIVKRIPVGAGLGGGSGNAAGAIVGLNDLWDLGRDRAGLVEFARQIGSDVPYCIAGGTARATGRGDELMTLDVVPRMSFVLGISARPLYTADVYEAFDELDRGPEVSGAALIGALRAGDSARVAKMLHNDLQRAALALRPELAQKKRALLDAGALGAAVSGSGPTIFAMARDRAHADTIAREVSGRFDRVEVVESRPTCIERLGGEPYLLP